MTITNQSHESNTIKNGAKHEPAEVRVQQILDASMSCFIKSGFHGASMSQIAKKAGLSKGSLYRYFEDKNAIIEAMFVKWDALFTDAIHLQMEKRQDLNPQQQLEDYFHITAEVLEENKALLPLWVELYTNAETMLLTKELMQDSKAEIKDLINECLSQGYFNESNSAEAITMTLLTLTEGLVAMGCIDSNLNIKTLAKQSWEVVIKGLVI